MPLKVATAKQAKVYQLNLDGGKVEVKQKKPRVYEEAEQQALYFSWLRQMEPKYPALRWIFSTLNGLAWKRGL